MTKNKAIDPDGEILDLVDENDQVIGEVEKNVANKNPNLIHREIGVLIFDQDKRVLLQQRGFKKKINPGLWTISTAGHVSRGETYEQAVHRELLEELGFDTKLVAIFKELWKELNETKFGTHFLGKYDGQKIVFEKKEIERVRFLSKEEFDKFFKKDNKIGSLSLKILTEFWEGKFDGLISQF